MLNTQTKEPKDETIFKAHPATINWKVFGADNRNLIKSPEPHEDGERPSPLSSQRESIQR